MEAAPPPDVARYAEQVVLVSRRALGPNLVAAYLYGSAVLGGFTPARSDVDILLVVAGAVRRATLEALGFAFGRGRTRPPPRGLQPDVLTVSAAGAAGRAPPVPPRLWSGAER